VFLFDRDYDAQPRKYDRADENAKAIVLTLILVLLVFGTTITVYVR
jgi:hypothetical protein